MSMLKSRCLLPKIAMFFFYLLSSSTLSCDSYVLNNFCFHVYAQKSLFKVENVNAFFLTSMLFLWQNFLDSTLSCELANPRAGSQLKTLQCDIRTTICLFLVSCDTVKYSRLVCLVSIFGMLRRDFVDCSQEVNLKAHIQKMVVVRKFFVILQR